MSRDGITNVEDRPCHTKSTHTTGTIEGNVSRPERVDRIFHAVADRRRRAVLYAMQSATVRDVHTIARTVAARTEDVPKAELAPEEITAAESYLVHAGLPELAAVGVVEYDQRSKTIRCDEYPPFVENLLELTESVENE